MAKAMTVLQSRMHFRQQWYTIPELARHWHTDPANVCRILQRFDIQPTRFEWSGWIFWQVSDMAVIDIENNQRSLFY